jgi:all-trans-retinol 13,14-reductase
MKPSVAVIGAGVAGMSAALILARRGFSTLLIEAGPRLAPVLRGFKRKGVLYDTGFHYAGCLNPGATMDAYFRYLGLAPRLRLAEPLSGLSDFFRYEDFTCEFPYDYSALRRVLVQRFSRDAVGIDRYLNAVRSLFESNAHCNPLGAHGTPFPGPPFNALDSGHRFSDRTLAEVLDAWLTDPQLKRLLGIHSLLYGADPRSVSFTEHARFVGSYYQSAHRILDGGRSLAKAFEAALAMAKVRVLTNHPVTEILARDAAGQKSGQEVVGLRFANGERLDCQAVVATVHPRLVAQLAPEPTFRQAYRQRMEASEDSFSAFAVFASTTRSIPRLEQGNLHLGSHPDFHLDRPAALPVEQRPLFIAQSVSRSPGAGLQPAGVAILCPASLSEVAAWGASRVGRRPASYRAFKNGIGRRVLDRALSCFPELADGLAPMACATPLTFRDYNHSPRGALYGLRRSADALAPLPVTRLKGLYLAGQAVTGPGVLGAMISAFIGCGPLCDGADALLQEVRECSNGS